MSKVKSGFAAVSIATVAGGISLAYASPNVLSEAYAQVSGIQGIQLSQVVDDAGASAPLASAQKAMAIATTYSHDMSGRQATTVYVRNIPVATFLKPADSEEQKVAASGESLPLETADSASELDAFVATINRFGQEGLDAGKIGVKWDKADEQYVIHVEEETLIAMNGDVILPTTTKDVAEDALQITNRLRRQIGNVEPLKDIEGRPRPPKVAAAPTNVSRYQAGWASWYGPGFHGNLTADGSRYDQYGLTAAHLTLPFGTRVRVTNQNNGRSVVVLVNDRGPYIHNRVIDLSLGAAQVIGVVDSGVAPVTIDIVN